MTYGLISIIIPAYNAEKTIEKCINSIRDQSFNNIEILVVDDGSTDSTKEKIVNLSQKDHRVKYIYKENGGVSSARNIGIKNATGEFIAFVDSDDMVKGNMYEKMYHAMQNDGVDLIICGVEIVEKSGVRLQKFSPRIVGTISDLESDFKEYMRCCCFNPPWNKLFKRDIISDLVYDENMKMYEDLVFNLQYIAQCTSIEILEDCLYIYDRTGEGSLEKIYSSGLFQNTLASYYEQKRFCNLFFDHRMDEYLYSRLFADLFIDIQKLVRFQNFKKRVCIPIIEQWANNTEIKRALYSNESTTIVLKKKIQFEIVKFLLKIKCYSLIVDIFKIKSLVRRRG